MTMRHIAKVTATGALLKRAATFAASHPFPAWIDSAECGVPPSTVIPRIRDSLVLRLVAGRRQARERTLYHAAGAP
jgi:hypothetical protein